MIRRVSAGPEPSPSMMVTSSCSSVTRTSSSAQAAPASESSTTSIPWRESPSQSPAAIGPPRLSESRTARVTSPGTTLLADASMASALTSPSASGS